MKTVKIEDEDFQVIQSWAECSQANILQLLPLQLIGVDQQDPAAAGRVRRLALTVLVPGLDKYAGDLTDHQWWRIGRLTNWIWKTRIDAKPFDSFTVDGPDGKPVVYLLPDDNFVNTSAIEISMANIHYLSFTRPKNPNHKAVLMLLSTLCRPQRTDLKKFRKSAEWNGDAREEYNTVLAEERAATFATLPLGVIMAITQYFEAMNGRFLKTYKDVYEPDPAADEEEPLYKNGEGLVTTLMDIATAGVFGDFDKVCKQNGHTVWLYLKDNNLKVKRANRKAAQQDKDN